MVLVLCVAFAMLVACCSNTSATSGVLRQRRRPALLGQSFNDLLDHGVGLRTYVETEGIGSCVGLALPPGYPSARFLEAGLETSKRFSR
jgi:hypothetical protein